MTRLILVGGVLAGAFGVALIVPAIVEYLDRGFLAGLGIMIVSLGVVLILSGVFASISAYAFRSLGRSDARRYFGQLCAA